MPWKPYGTRLRKCTVATGGALKSVASTTIRSLASRASSYTTDRTQP
jgi:hypothetical protein